MFKFWPSNLQPIALSEGARQEIARIVGTGRNDRTRVESVRCFLDALDADFSFYVNSSNEKSPLTRKRVANQLCAVEKASADLIQAIRRLDREVRYYLNGAFQRERPRTPTEASTDSLNPSAETVTGLLRRLLTLEDAVIATRRLAGEELPNNPSRAPDRKNEFLAYSVAKVMREQLKQQPTADGRSPVGTPYERVLQAVLEDASCHLTSRRGSSRDTVFRLAKTALKALRLESSGQANEEK